MSWWESALSVATTIGKVAGALSGSSHQMVGYRVFSSGSKNPKIDNILFKRLDDGSTMAYNTAEDEKLACQLFFPGDSRSGLQGTSLIIPGLNKIDVSPAFSAYAMADIDHFLITPSNPESVVAAEVIGTDPPTSTIQSQGSNIPAGVTVGLGPYFNVSVSASDRTVMVTVLGAFTLVGIVLLNVRGAGATFCRIANVVKKKSGVDDVDGNTITVSLPGGIDVSDGIQSLDITASVTTVSYHAVVADIVGKGVVQRITAEEIAQIGKLTLL